MTENEIAWSAIGASAGVIETKTNNVRLICSITSYVMKNVTMRNATMTMTFVMGKFVILAETKRYWATIHVTHCATTKAVSTMVATVLYVAMSVKLVKVHIIQMRFEKLNVIMKCVIGALARDTVIKMRSVNRPYS